MPHLVQDRLFFGNISDAVEVLQGTSTEFTRILSLLCSASISFFSDWRPGLSIPIKEIRKVFVGADESLPKKSLAPGKLLYSLEHAAPEPKLVRMAVLLRDTEDEDLLDYLAGCLDFIVESRKKGSVLVHCFAGVSRSMARSSLVFPHMDIVLPFLTGNELSGQGESASVDPKQYVKDLIALKKLISYIYKNSSTKPKILAPGGFFDARWFADMLQTSGPGVVNGVTHHIYNLGAGVDKELIYKIQDPYYLDQIVQTYNDIETIINNFGPWSAAWVGESGGAYNSRGKDVSNTFTDSFW